MRWLLLTICCFVVVDGQAEVTDQPPGFQQILHQAYADVVYFEAAFVQHKQVKFLSQPLISKGRLKYAKDHGFIWHIIEPLNVKTVINADGVFKDSAFYTKQKVKDPQIKMVANLLSELLESDLKRINRQFEITAVTKDVERGRWVAQMDAKSRWVKQAVTTLQIEGDLDDDQTPGAMNTIQFLDPSGNRTRLELSDQVLQQTPVTAEQSHAFQ